ncbi:RsiV family protein [uncultured Clostridium sp.]|uniref:RsiV family protein n=1 Tax=uncultured Clostridium sp. TaxID=59620 RepID=UPI002582E591|nr:RsiV family protein [uncultured Clostridium sp.]
MAQKEWKQEEMKQNQGRTEQNQRKKVRKKTGYRAVLAASMFLIAASAALSACKKSPAAETTAQTQAAEKTEDTVSTALGSADRMLEENGMLYLKYRTEIRSLSKETGEMKTLCQFDKADENSTFWVYGGGLYFDRMQVESGSTEGTELYGLYRLDLESGEEEHLADLTDRPSVLYASKNRLYVKGYNMNVIYTLDENGKTAGELSPSDTIYGEIPAGCSELFNGILPYYTEQFGYMPVQNETCLVIADADGSHPREISDITNTSSVLFAKDAFFALLRDGNGNTQCYRYEVSDPEKRTLLYETAENISLVQYQDGYLYLMENQASQISTGKHSFKRIAADVEADAAANAAEAQNALFTVEEEPGMTNDFSLYGNFYVTGNQAYCQQFKDYGVYLGEKTLDDAAGGEVTLLEPVLFQSPIRELGHVEAQSETLKSADGSRELGSVYAERLVFDGENDAVEAMNQTMQELQVSVLSAARTDAMNLDTEMSGDTAQPVYSMALTIDGDNAITYLDDHYVCVRADGYEYTGGAHGTPFRQYFVFDRETGARLSLSDVLENPVEELQAKVGAAFRELAEKTNFAFESPEDLEHTVADGISYESPFYLSETGVVFYYAPYEIASYAEGFPEVTIPYNELEMKIALSK